MRKTLLCLFFSAALALAGCQSSEEKDMLKSYEVSYDMDSVLLDSGTGGSAAFFAENLCVVETEEAYTDDLIKAGAAIIFNRTDNEVIFSNGANEQLYPASITKLLTALVAIENGDLDSTVKVTEDMLEGLSGTSLAGLKAGETYSLEALLYGTLLPSGNDAAVAVASLVGNGDVDNFVQLMNETAKEIGATKSHFMNPHGLHDDNHFTTAYDVYLIMNRLLDYGDIIEPIFSCGSYTANYTLEDGTTGERTFKTSVRYISGDAESPEGVTVVGGKTGTTTPAGSCLALLSRDAAGKEYISVILKASGRDSLYEQMDELFSKILK